MNMIIQRNDIPALLRPYYTKLIIKRNEIGIKVVELYTGKWRALVIPYIEYIGMLELGRFLTLEETVYQMNGDINDFRLCNLDILNDIGPYPKVYTLRDLNIYGRVVFEGETFADVKCFEDYFKVGNMGSFYSKRSGKFLRCNSNMKGYSSSATKFNGREGGTKLFRIHREVAISFVSNPERKPLVNHVTGNKKDNEFYNLEWVTYTENMLHAREMGLFKYAVGEDVASAKLSVKDVLKIRELHRQGINYSRIAKMYNMHHSHIREVVLGTKWKHVPT